MSHCILLAYQVATLFDRLNPALFKNYNYANPAVSCLISHNLFSKFHYFMKCHNQAQRHHSGMVIDTIPWANSAKIRNFDNTTDLFYQPSTNRLNSSLI
ncbi:Uncharacterised protein [Legionella pneumophila]|nr:Uncharacterised protein [Legionella pneumophila]